MFRTWMISVIFFALTAHAAVAEPTRLVEQIHSSHDELGLLEADMFPSVAAPETVDEYTRLALERNAALQAAFARWRAAMERIPQAKALPDPQLTFTHYLEEVQTRTGPQESKLQLTQMFPWFGTLRSREKVATRDAESAWWAMEAQAQALVQNVKETFYDYGYLAQSIDIVQENLILLKDLEPIVQRRVQTGVDSQASLVRLQVEIGKIENELAALQDRQSKFSARLRSFINLRGREILSMPSIPSARILDYEEVALLDRLERENPELRALGFRVKAAEERKDVARREGYPDFMLGISYIDTGESVSFPRPPDSGEDPIMLSVGIRLPIWRDKYSAKVREAESSRRATSNQRHQRLNDLRADLENTLYRLDDAERQINLYRDTLLPRAQQALELTEIAYESGRASLLDVIDSQREFLVFTLAYRRAEADYHIQVAVLEALCGGTLS